MRPELEVFDTGHLVLVHELIRDGLIDDPPMIQLCMGIPYGAPDDPATLLAMVDRLPPDAVFSAFSIGRMQMPFVAHGGARRRQRARRARGQPLPRARAGWPRTASSSSAPSTILEAMNVRVLGPDEVREQARRCAADG